MAFWSSLNFQNLLNYVPSLLESLHDVVMVWLVVVLLIVCFISSSVFLSLKSRLFPDSLLLETTWTLVPIIILLLIAFPSLRLLCLQDSVGPTPLYTLKVISNQWNWQTESLEIFDHLIDSDALDVVASYEVPMLILSNEEHRVLTISTDVLHSLGIPSLGVKLDTAPGRISATVIESKSPGILLGSCYELCGSGHSAMPFSMISI